MKLYIVMPVINCFNFTTQAVNSIKSKCNLILIDNGSFDETPQWGKDHDTFNKRPFNEHIQDLIYIRNDVIKSVSASWNQGIKRAFEDPECQYVAVLNNDIVLHPKTLEHLMAFMDHTKYIMVTGDNIKDRMSPEVLQTLELPMPYTDFDCMMINEWRAEGPDFSCYMINRETIDYIGWFDENIKGAYCEDWDYHARINRAWRWGLQYGEPNPQRMHAKRLTTAPYYHFASQTITRNIPLRHTISVQHGKNKEYYQKKWGVFTDDCHSEVMDGKGNVTPWGDATKNWKDWNI